MKDELKDFHSIMDSQIKRLQDGLNMEINIMVLRDLKRLAEIGAFSITEDKPVFKASEDDRLELTQRVRLKWKGEAELTRLKIENEELRSKLEELKRFINE